ncbi:MAG: GtrA family protein [Oscillospiraceae bacterium]|nr:GtrA family protein [Oscillospiraceae bacterium]
MLDALIKKILSVFPRFIRDFYYKHESVMLYLIVGAMTTVVSLITQYVPASFGLPTAVNTTISWICAVTFAFFTNKVWVFKDEAREKSDWIKQALSFYAARLVTYFAELGFMILTVDVLSQNEYIMKLIAQIFVLIVNYLFSKLVIFRKKPKEEKIEN